MPNMVENHHPGRGRPGKPSPEWLRKAFVAALLAAITIGFYWRLVLTDQYTWMNGPDLARQVLPWLQFQAGELRQGRLPLWDPYLFGGQPLLAQAQPGVAYPLNWILLMLPLRDGWVQLTWLHWYYVAIHFMGVLFAYRLCRDAALTRTAAVAGAVVYGLGGFMGHNDWPQMLNGGVWIPLVLLCLLRVATRGQDGWYASACGGMCLGMTFLSGHHQVPIYTSLMAAGVWIWIVASGSSETWRRRGMAGVFFFVVAGLVSGVQSLPAWEYAQHAYRWVGTVQPVGGGDKIPYNIHEQYSLRPDFLLGILFPGIVGPTGVLAGAAAFVLAGCGVALGWKKAAVRVATFVWIGGLLFAMGGSVWFHGLLYALVPMLEKARTPAMAAAVAQAGIALLASFGIDEIAKLLPAERQTRLRPAILGASGLGAAVFAIWMVQAMIRQVTGDPRSLVTAVCALLTAAVLAAWSRSAFSNLGAQACLIAIILIELGNGMVSYLPHRSKGYGELVRMRDTAPLVRAVREAAAEKGEWGRVDFGGAPGARWQTEGSIGDFYGIESFHGYLASLTTNLVDAGMGDEETLLHYGVRYRISPEPVGGWNEMVAQSDGWKLWRNGQAFPPVWTLHWSGPLDDMLPAPRIESCRGGDEAYLLREQSNRVVLWAEMACPGVLVLSATAYPGWRAYIDGKPAPMRTAYGSLRAVAVDGGSHRVEMRYEPGSVRWGVGLTLAGFLLILIAGPLDLRYKL
ncbi:MAG: hypothetical protein R2762_05120 [Bryobacteraceae bacterium]